MMNATAVLPSAPPTAMNPGIMSLPNPDDYRIPAPKSEEKKDAGTEEVKTRLANHIRKQWETAKQHREQIGVDLQIMNSKRACNREYTPTKLAEIRAFEGNPNYVPPYHPLIDVKCRALQAKMASRILAPGDRPWSINPTPIPEVPADLKAFKEQDMALKMAEQALTQGALPSVEAVDQVMPDIEKQLLALMVKRSKEVNEEATQRLDDQLREGGWYEAVKKCLYDFVRKPVAVLKGPIQKKRTEYTHEYNEVTGKWEIVITDRKLDTWERVAAEKIYPVPNASTVDDGDLIELSSYKRRNLYEAIGIEGYDEAAIRRVLRQWESAGLHEWTMTDSEKAALEGKSTTDLGPDIDCLIFWGTAPGSMLLEWGMKEDVIDDPDKEYDIWAELIGTEIIMARLNPDPLHGKPYHKASLIEDPDRFFNHSLYDILEGLAGICCAVLRACQTNAAFSSGPIMDIAVDQLENRNDTVLYPRRTIRRTTKMMQDLQRAVNFYQPQIMTGPLSQFLEFCHQLADEWTGVMRISHGGDTQPGGADSTASGMSMNISESGIGVKFSLSNFDDGIIGPSVSRQYQVNLYENPGGLWSSPYLDPKIVARGSSSSSMMAKEQQAVRRNELSATLSPEEKQIMGPEGLRELLREKILALDMDPDKLMPQEREQIRQMTGIEFPGQQTPGQPQLPGPEAENLNVAGDKSSGRDFALPLYPRRGNA